MTTRRRFLGTLGKALGAGGLLLPWTGKGALALPADLGTAAQLPLTAAPLPFSADALKLREIRRALHAIRVSDDRTGWRYRLCEPPINGDYPQRWLHMMTEEYAPMEKRLAARPVRSWADCVELAEAIWTFWDKEDRNMGPTASKLSTDRGRASIAYHQRHLIAALVEGVLALGGGDRFDPTILVVEDGAT